MSNYCRSRLVLISMKQNTLENSWVIKKKNQSYNWLKSWKSREKSFTRTSNSLTSFIQNLPWLICHLPPRAMEMIFTSSHLSLRCSILWHIVSMSAGDVEISLSSSCLIQPLQADEGRNICICLAWPWQSRKEKTGISITPFSPSCCVFQTFFTQTLWKHGNISCTWKNRDCVMGQR